MNRNALQILVHGFFLVSSFLLYLFFFSVTLLLILQIEVRWRDLKNRLKENLRGFRVWVEIMIIFFCLVEWLILNRGPLERLVMRDVGWRIIGRRINEIFITSWLRWNIILLGIFVSLHVKKWHIYCKKYDSDMCVLKYLLWWYINCNFIGVWI